MHPLSIPPGVDVGFQPSVCKAQTQVLSIANDATGAGQDNSQNC